MRHLRTHAEASPDLKAFAFPVGRSTSASSGPKAPFAFKDFTFRALDERTDALAHGLTSIGLRRGMKTVLMLKPGEDLFLVLIAMFKVGAIPVIVDPGMGLSRMLHCYRTTGAEAFIGLPIAHLVRKLSRRAFATIEVSVTSGTFGGHALDSLYLTDRGPYPLPDVSPDDLLMLSFTTGSTGPAKGVESTHRMVDAMLAEIVSLYGFRPGDVGLVTLPLFVLVDLLAGCTSVLAPMDPTRPAKVDPDDLLDTIETFGVRHMFASPALLHRIGPSATAKPARVASLRTVVSGGAPASFAVLSALQKALHDEANLHTTYGATEVLPITSIAFAALKDSMKGSAEGHGVCVGKPMERLALRLITLSDEPIPRWHDGLEVPHGGIGEVTVSGPMVSTRYHENPDGNALHKIADEGRVWHRTGDVGWLDAEGRLWLCGRKRQRVHTQKGPLHTFKCEAILDAHPEVYRSALVGVGPRGNERPFMCIERIPRHATSPTDEALLTELRALAARHPETRNIEDLLIHPGFPVDIRHNAKIQREELAVWAGAKKDLIAIPRAPLAVLAIPLLGWLYLVLALFFWPLPHEALTIAWWVILFLHFVVHPLQILKGLPVGHRVAQSTATIAWMTTVFGATYWRPLIRANAQELRR